MSAHAHRHLVKALLKEHGRTFCTELGIDISDSAPSALFRWLCASILLGSGIRREIALAAADALAANGWTTPEKMAESTWECRRRTLSCAGYIRHDESTARMLKDTTCALLEQYRGDLRVLRDCADYDPAEERRRLVAFNGLGEGGADVFFREVQLAWDEIYPFADGRVLKAARLMGLPGTAEDLAKLVSRADYPRLLAAIVRADPSHRHHVLTAAA